MQSNESNRSQFLKTGTAALAPAALPWSVGSYAAIPGANDRVRTPSSAAATA